MKTVNEITLTGSLCLVLGFATTAFAQQSGSGEPGSPNASAPSNKSQPAGRPTAKLDAKAPENDDALHLTDEQKSRIKSIREDAKQTRARRAEGFFAQRRSQGAEGPGNPQGDARASVGRDDSGPAAAVGQRAACAARSPARRKQTARLDSDPPTGRR